MAEKMTALDKDDIDAVMEDAGFRYVQLLSTWTRGRTHVYIDNWYTIIWWGFEEYFRGTLPVASGEFMEALARAELKG